MAKPWNLAVLRTLRNTPTAALAACCALAVGLGGCRAVDNAQVDVMERELRQQEDYIYELEDYLIEYSEKLRECRTCQPETMMGTASSSTSSAKPEPTLAKDPPRSTAPRRRNGARVVPPIEAAGGAPDAFDAPPIVAPPTVTPTAPSIAPPVTAPAAEPIDPSELEAPGLEIGPTSGLQWKGAAPLAAAPVTDETPLFIPDPADYQLDAESTELANEQAPAQADSVGATADSAVDAGNAPELVAADNSVPVVPAEPLLPPPADAERLTAERLQIRRVFGDAASDEGAAAGSLLVVVEALNATDEPVDANGEISLMVMAGETQETLKRVERWDFTAEETQAAWQSSQLGDGLHLELPLQGESLPAGRLELWARLVDANGTKLLARVPFAAEELASLDMSTMDPESGAEQAVAQQIEPPTAATAGGAEVVATTTQSTTTDAPIATPATTATTAWRASHESATRASSTASTAGNPAGSWTRQPPGGRAPLAGTPRVATALDGPPRWQQGSAEAPKSERGGAWAPFR